MVDLRQLEKEFDTVATSLKRRGIDEKLLEKLKIVFEEKKGIQKRMEAAQAEQNQKANFLVSISVKVKILPSFKKRLLKIKFAYLL